MIIHQIWMQGEDLVPRSYKEYSRALRELNPGMQYRLWNDSQLEEVCDRLGPIYGKAYRACRYMHQKVDFGRYCVIYTYGGISVDMDVQPLRSLAPLVEALPEDRLGLSEFPTNRVESSLLSGGKHTWWLNNATLIAKTPRNRACKILVDKMAHAILTRTWVTMMPKNIAITYTTGPMHFMDVFRDMDPSLWVMIPHKYLEPCSGYHKSCKLSDKAILYHKHDGTWLPRWYATAMRMYYRARENPVLVVVSLVLLVYLIRNRFFIR